MTAIPPARKYLGPPLLRPRLSPFTRWYTPSIAPASLPARWERRRCGFGGLCKPCSLRCGEGVRTVCAKCEFGIRIRAVASEFSRSSATLSTNLQKRNRPNATEFLHRQGFVSVSGGGAPTNLRRALRDQPSCAGAQGQRGRTSSESPSDSHSDTARSQAIGVWVGEQPSCAVCANSAMRGGTFCDNACAGLFDVFAPPCPRAAIRRAGAQAGRAGRGPQEVSPGDRDAASVEQVSRKLASWYLEHSTSESLPSHLAMRTPSCLSLGPREHARPRLRRENAAGHRRTMGRRLRRRTQAGIAAGDRQRKSEDR